MIDDASLNGIFKNMKASSEHKLIHDQQNMKEKVFKEFGKLSKEGLLSNTISEVYSLKVYDSKKQPLSAIDMYPSTDENLYNHLKSQLKSFYGEFQQISEDGFNLMTYLEYLLNGYDPLYLYWCSYPQISYDIIDQADTYYFTLLRFDAAEYKKNLYFHGELHPLIKSLYYSWISQCKEVSYGNTFRKAAANMNALLSAIWDPINILSTLKYEGSQNKGSLVFIGSQLPKILLSLETPVPLSEYRQIRKLLQMSQAQHYLLIDDRQMAIGFGLILSPEPVYRIDFLDHLSWKLYYGREEFLSCTNLLPMLPTSGNILNHLSKQLALTFDGLPYNEELLLRIIGEAMHQSKGTMIVINEKAKEEAERLMTSSIKIKPIQLTSRQVKMVTGIDGALIIDTNGYCHAIGSILDGTSTDNGDSSRGARYNSALRYLNTQQTEDNACIIIVVSEDRYMDIIATS